MTNYFEFFGIEPTFLLDKADLKKRFYLNSKKYHPDFYTLESAEKQEEILTLSTLNNKAYKTLSNFHFRMHHLLELHGVIEDEGKASLPQTFLLQMMDVNEAIMELQFDPDQEAKAKIESVILSFEDEQFKKIQMFLEAYNHSNPDINVLNRVKDYFFKRKYLLRLKENLDKFAAL